MTKLEELINDYYATEDIDLREHLDATIKESEDDGETVSELCNLLHYLNKVVK